MIKKLPISIGRQLGLLLMLPMLFLFSEANASHVSGGSIKYKALGSNQYYIEVAVFRDCSGIQYSAATATITAQCMPLGTPSNYILTHLAFVAPTPTPFGGPYSAISFTVGGTALAVEEVSDVCDKVLDPSKTPNTRCRGTGSGILGYTRFKYSGIITLAPACNYWRLNFTPQCCRNTGSSNISTGGMSVETWFDSQNFPNNSAPDFADEVKPIPSACVGKEVKYGIGTVDHDGDSLRFEVACAKGTVNTCVTYRSGFSATAPADSFKMDSATGLIRFVPKTAGKRVVAFWVKEYERCTGKWKAQTLRDVQFRVESCSNNIPKDISGISNIQGKGVKKLGDFKLQVCNGVNFSFEDTIYDPDITDTLIVQSNHSVVMPGSQMTVTSLAKNKAVVKFSWKAALGLNPVKIFYMVFNDDRCNYPGNGFSVFELEVRNSTNAGEDQAICLGVDTAYLEASGGKRYVWNSVYGDSLIWSGPNRNVWGDTTATDTNKRLKFFPSVTTFLDVWSDMKEGCVVAAACQDRDSVKIVAAKNYNLDKHADTILCYHDSSFQIYAKPDSQNFVYSYQWSDTSVVSNDTIYNPIATVQRSQYLYIDVSSDSGCAKKDSIYVGVTPPMPPSIIATTKSDPACAGVPAKIDLSLGRLPTSCGATTSKCVGAQDFHTSQSTANSNGSGTTGPANWPCPYGGAQASARQQFIYTANELNAIGVNAGTIDGLGFNVTSINGVGNLGGYTIKLKCLSKNDSTLNSFVITGLTTVFTSKTVTPVAGWNTHVFDVNYDYDGVSNLLVDICWDNGGGNTSANAAVAYVATAHNSAVGYMASGGACNSQFLGFTSRVNRPTLKLSYCGARDTTEFNYLWTPSTGLNYDTVTSPTASITQSMTYTVQVTDTFGKCSDTASITLTVANIDAGPDTSMCPNDTIQLMPNFTASCKGKGNFKWEPSQYFPNDSVQNPLVSVPQTTVVTVTFSDSCGCNLQDSLTIFADSVKFDHVRNNPDCGLSNGEFIFRPNGGFGYMQYSVDSGQTWTMDTSVKNLSIGFYGLQMRDSMQCYSELIPDTMFNKGAPQIDSVALTHVSCGGFSDGEVEIFTTGGIRPLSYSVDSGTTWVSTKKIKKLKAGVYKVIARGRFGCESFPKYVTITEPDTLFVKFNTYIDSCYQQGHGYAIGVANAGTPPYTYNWSGRAPGAGHNPLVIGDTAYTKLFKHNRYKLVLQDANGCGLDTTFSIDEIDQIVIDSLNYIPTTCFGYPDGKIIMSGLGGNPPDSLHNWWYQFSIDSGKTFFDHTSGSNLKLAVLDSSKATGVNGPIYEGSYDLVIRDGKGCLGHSNIYVEEPPEMVLTTTTDSIRICVSTCTKLEVFGIGGNSNTHTYHWTPTVSNTNVANVCPDQDELYSVYSTDNRGCSSNGLILKVDLYDSLRTNINADTAICDGAFAQLNVLASGGDGKGYEYLWQPFSDLSNAFIKNPIASPSTEKTFTVKVSDLCGSPAVYDSVKISILPQPVVDFLADTLEGCPPLYAKFQNNTNASAICTWSFGDGTGVQTCSDVYKTYSASGTYDVKLKVTSIDGCVDSLIREEYIDIYKVPTASFEIDPQPTTILNTLVNFEDQSDGRIVSWEWNFAGLDTSMNRHPSFRFPDEVANTYPVRLDVYSDQGCQDDTIRVVEINAEYFLYVPTSFTPNGDGKNDVWKPLGTGFESDYFHVLVFDRWGKLVFETYDYDEYWNGTVKDTEELAAVGSYTWKIVTGDAEDVKKRHERYGNVTIVK